MTLDDPACIAERRDDRDAPRVVLPWTCGGLLTLEPLDEALRARGYREEAILYCDFVGV